jgi:hypothetical protein
VIAALARAPIARLIRSRRAKLTVSGWCLVAGSFALAARSGGSSHGADHVLLGAYGPLVLPLLAYALVGAVVAGRSLSSSTSSVVALGAPPANAAAVTIIVAAAVCILSCGLLAFIVDVLAHGSADPPLARDAFASAYAAGLGGATYASWFALGASFGKRGGGRPVLLIVDWLLGASDGAPALFPPRGHVRNLLGGTAPMDLSERASAGVLVIIAIACALIAVRRARLGTLATPGW